MATYTVLLPPPSKRAGPSTRMERAVFVRDGFSWPAFLFPVLWLLFNRMWLILILFVAIAVGIAIAVDAIGGPIEGIAAFAFTLLFGFEANGLKRWALMQRGYEFVAVMVGRRADCEQRFYAEELDTADYPPARPEPVHGRTTTPPPQLAGDTGILGLFPEKGAIS